MSIQEILKLTDEDFIAIDGDSAKALVRLMKRLYSEKRMDGNEMRDAAQLLQYVLEHGFDLAELEL